MNNHQKPIITASEIGEYLYCKRGWWLLQKDSLPQNEAMLEGSTQHLDLSKNVSSYRILLIFTILLLGLGLALILSLILDILF